MSAPQLRGYQLDALAAILAVWTIDKQNRLLVKMPTGTGKTVMFAAMLPYLGSRLLGGKGARMLVIAHREELLDQAAEKIQRANPGLMVSIEQGERRAHRYSDVVIASIQTLAAMKFRRLTQLLRHHDFRLVIVDEAHHAAASSYRTALVHLGFLPPAEASDQENVEAADFDDVAVMEAALKGWDAVSSKDRLLVGVTATPNRSDAIGLGCVFQTIAYSYDLKVAIDDGHLVPIVPWVIETGASLEGVRMQRGDFNQRDLAEAVNTGERNDLAVAAWQEKAPGAPTIAFTVDVAHAHELALAFQASGVRARALSGETPREERRQILRSFTEGQIDVVTNCMVLTEGTDLPLTGCILHAKPTKSPTLYEQMTGRGLRPHPGKANCIVLDLVDVARRHSLQTSPMLYGLPPGLKVQGKDLREVAAAVDELLTRVPGFNLEKQLGAGGLTLEQLQARATTFNIWTVEPLEASIASAVGMNWIKTGADAYRIQYPWQDGSETLTVGRDLLGHFEVTATFRPTPPPGQYPDPTAKRQRTLVGGVPEAAGAMKLAEAFIAQERPQAARLKDREASWRYRPATPKQVGLLNMMRVPFKPGLTSGAASDLIDLVRSRRGR